MYDKASKLNNVHLVSAKMYLMFSQNYDLLRCINCVVTGGGGGGGQ